MDTSLLDMLHDPPEQQFLPVIDGVDVDLDRRLQEAVDEDRVRGNDRISLP